jgi:hypothetical protein
MAGKSSAWAADAARKAPVANTPNPHAAIRTHLKMATFMLSSRIFAVLRG